MSCISTRALLSAHVATADNKLVMNQPRRAETRSQELASHPLAPTIGIGYYQGDTKLTTIGLCVTTFILPAVHLSVVQIHGWDGF